MPAIAAASDSPALRPVAALFVRADSVYKSMPGVDAWDAERDARGWTGGSPLIAHPPCRAWGRLRQFAKPRPDEKELARFAVANIRRFGGVLEHPAGSTLWTDQGMPRPGEFPDEWGGGGRSRWSSSAGGIGPKKRPGCTWLAASRQTRQPSRAEKGARRTASARPRAIRGCRL